MNILILFLGEKKPKRLLKVSYMEEMIAVQEWIGHYVISQGVSAAGNSSNVPKV